MAFSFKKRKRPSEKEKNWAKNQKIFRIFIKERKTIGNRRKSSPIINNIKAKTDENREQEEFNKL